MDYPTAIVIVSAIIATVLGVIKLINHRRSNSNPNSYVKKSYQSVAVCNELHGSLTRELKTIKSDVSFIREKLWEYIQSQQS